MRKQLLALGVLCALLPGLVLHTQAAEAPAVSAASAVLMDGETGRILYANNENEPRAIASITKLMTALVAAEWAQGDLSRTVTIRQKWTGIEGTSLYLRAGEKLTLETLLYGLLLHSGNDAAVALAASCAGDVETFVGWMNQRAQDLGMTNTHFSDPNGLGDENHYSTALDMARLGAACLQNPTVAKITATRSITLEGRSFTNHNKLLWLYPGCTGMKTGYTRQAGRTLVSSAEKEGQTLICVTLNDRNDWTDHQALLDYGFETFPRQVLAEEGETFRQVPVEGSLLRQVPAVAWGEVAWPLREGETVRTEIDLPVSVQAPVTQGEIAGTVTFYVGDRKVGETYLVWGKSAGLDVVSPDSERSPLGFLKKLAGME
ncbi:D-alanyl-D-alanine carboxypeptidase family protein [Evtepia sp.]|uniref:D-alanyl-D-alanine carboxypeptidase family protein n=1 Tax=Evtepia sp. TaxID=2773933 RepID=UPI002A8120AA|nr:D-alanyl-D-alanine carboxypeptidase family protein [Evtepia sp.]MDY4430970.1 D-alanyl-D-alanine carboxypeptidase family protein [Evtepia sp.]